MSVNLFDANFYRAANLDLQGFNNAQALSHFQNTGLNEGRAFSPFVDLNFYRASNADLSGFSNRQAYEHLSNTGIREGRKFSPLIDLNYYQRHNGDLASFNNEELFEHLRRSGVLEGRRFSLLVDLNFYRSVNGDLTSFNNYQALQHLQTSGLAEGRRFSPFFNQDVYVAANLDVAKQGWNNTQLFWHLVNTGVTEGRRFSVTFDVNYYRNTYPDLAQAGLNNTQLLEHFQDNGLINEGRSSSESFNVKYYLNNYPDLKAAGLNYQQAQQHFEINGFRERRLGNPSGEISLPTDPGNTTNNAFNFGILNGSRIVKEFVGSNDADYYRFTLGTINNFSLTLNGLTSDADVQLLDSNGNTIISSYNSSTLAETINQQLNPGTYYIKVYPYQQSGVNTNYNLTLSATPTSPPASVFSSIYGYGIVDAAAAVAKAIGQSAFANLASVGGDNDTVNVPEVWARGYTGQGITVAVIDDGIDINHQDLRGNIWRNTREIADNGIDDDRNGYIDDINGWNFGLYNKNVLPSGSHGTHVAGTIAAVNNGIGVTGVVYNARIMPIRVSNNEDLWVGNLANAIRYAVDNGARVINMSLSSNDFPGLREALAYAASRNVITVSAAGNDTLLTPTYPASYATQYGISVGAIANFSNAAGSDSRMRHVVAPGVSVYSTTPNNTYSYDYGTSMAAGYVSGIVALMLSANPNLTSEQVRNILTSSASRVV
ncbi:S8 family serine peptidase [Iningainema tapete]|uniref:S8 family serine peptidase n=1 Tax=Iningainema tapete BLCC-T55 TaxID=2748662 RepID=A0A8J6XGL2_9CYAN|nr:S8 family serine peptidase [Iningainema tapete]MBD2771641.1 S8 family serine peptidase [Iningainema tapete BLCC-T55]